MTLEEEKDFAEKSIRAIYKCTEELHTTRDKLDMNTFLNWLVEKVIREEKQNETTHIDISV